MKIQSQNHTYTVVAKIKTGFGRTNLLVKNEQGVSCLLLKIDEPKVTRKLAPLFISFKESETFSDFIESFPFEGGICAVFVHRADSRDFPIRRALAGTLPIARARAMRSLLGALLEQSMPSCVMCDVLRPENLMCSPGGTVKLVYNLVLNEDYDRDCTDKVQIMLAEVVRAISTDIKAPVLDRFIADLDALAFADTLEIYAAFAEITDEVSAAQIIVTQKISIKERLESAAASLSSKIIPAVAGIILLAGLLVLVNLFYRTVISPPPVDNKITEIGTVEIHDDNKP